MVLTRSLQEARIQILIERNVTGGKGYNPRPIHPKETIDNTELQRILKIMESRSEWQELTEDPSVFPIYPPITDPDQRTIYRY